MKYTPPARIASIQPFLVMDILERARQLQAEGREVIHLEVGEPDFDTPAVIVQAAQRALSEGHTHYTTALGIPEVGVAVARSLANEPSLLLADEPTGQLDSNTGREIVELLASTVRRQGIAAVITAHDPAMMAVADTVLQLKDGRFID